MTGAELKQVRKRLGLSQDALAKRLGMSRTMIGYMERGRAYNGKPVAIQKRTAMAVMALVKSEGGK